MNSPIEGLGYSLFGVILGIGWIIPLGIFLVFILTALLNLFLIILKKDKINFKQLLKHFCLDAPLIILFTLFFSLIEGNFFAFLLKNEFLSLDYYISIAFFLLSPLTYFLAKQKKQMPIWVFTLSSYLYLLSSGKVKIVEWVKPSLLFPYRNIILAILLMALALYGVYKVRAFMRHKQDKTYLKKEISRLFIYLGISLILLTCLSKNFLLSFAIFYLCLPPYLFKFLLKDRKRDFISLKDYFKYVFSVLVLITLIFISSVSIERKKDFLNNLSKLNPSHKEQNNEYANFPS